MYIKLLFSFCFKCSRVCSRLSSAVHALVFFQKENAFRRKFDPDFSFLMAFLVIVVICGSCQSDDGNDTIYYDGVYVHTQPVMEQVPVYGQPPSAAHVWCISSLWTAISLFNSSESGIRIQRTILSKTDTCHIQFASFLRRLSTV